MRDYFLTWWDSTRDSFQEYWNDNDDDTCPWTENSNISLVVSTLLLVSIMGCKFLRLYDQCLVSRENPDPYSELTRIKRILNIPDRKVISIPCNGRKSQKLLMGIFQDYDELINNGQFAVPSRNRVIDRLITEIPLMRYFHAREVNGNLIFHKQFDMNISTVGCLSRASLHFLKHMLWLQVRFESVSDNPRQIRRMMDTWHDYWWNHCLIEIKIAYRLTRENFHQWSDGILEFEDLRDMIDLLREEITYNEPARTLARFRERYAAELERERCKSLSIEYHSTNESGSYPLDILKELSLSFLQGPMVPDSSDSFGSGIPLQGTLSSRIIREDDSLDGTLNPSMDNGFMELLDY